MAIAKAAFLLSSRGGVKPNMKGLQSLSSTPRDLRKFGLMVGGVFLLLGGLFLWRHRPVWPWLITPGVILFGLGLVAPRSLRKIYIAWMAMAFMLGLIVSTILLTLFFFAVVTPIAWIARLSGKDFLSLQLDPLAKSYWSLRPVTQSEPANYERQF
jgi:hypothetical protein